jgi:uncharacterized protein with HEPN domain
MVRAAVKSQFEVIGEALAQLAKHSPHLVAGVPHWREAIGFRNVLIHGYAEVDDVRVWQVVQLNLPDMAREVDRLLNQADDQRP